MKEFYGRKYTSVGYIVGKLERKRSIGRPRRRWEDKTKWIFKK
jgi:hypothetical protein